MISPFKQSRMGELWRIRMPIFGGPITFLWWHEWSSQDVVIWQALANFRKITWAPLVQNHLAWKLGCYMWLLSLEQRFRDSLHITRTISSCCPGRFNFSWRWIFSSWPSYSISINELERAIFIVRWPLCHVQDWGSIKTGHLDGLYCRRVGAQFRDITE